MKRKCIKRFISVFIVTLIVMQILPTCAFATSININESTMLTSSNEDTGTNIAIEMKDERTEFSKTYLLEDGSYHSITTYAPVHENINGQWENIDESLEQDVDTIDEAQTLLQEASIQQYEQQVTLNSDVELASVETTSTEKSMIINTTACTVNTDGQAVLQRNKGLVAKLSDIEYYHDQNKLVTNATVNIMCNVSQAGVIDLKEMIGAWTPATDLTNYDFSSKKVLGRANCSSNGLFSWDITDLYSKWDKSAQDNNGFILYVTSRNSNITIASLYIAVTYRDFDETDIDTTYHTVDMSRAGTVYINDLTGSLKLEQDVLKIPRSAMPIDLKRIYNLSDTFDSNTTTGLRWNYESVIFLDDGVASWETIDGTVKRFVQSEPTVISNGYTKYSLKSNTQGSVEEAVLWVKTTELDKTEHDYTNFYINANNIKYLFDNSGRLIKMQLRNDESNCIDFNYSGDNLTSVSYMDGDITSSIQFIYSSNQTRVLFSTFNASSTETSYQELVTINTSYDSYNNYTIYRVTYSDNKTVEYTYNYFHELVSIKDENENELNIIYYDDAMKGNRVCIYEIYRNNVDDETSYEYVNYFDWETYKRTYYINGEEQVEEIQYDKDFKIVSHKDANGDYTFVFYDETGEINSYVVSDDSMNSIYCNGIETSQDIGSLEYQNDSFFSISSYSDFTSNHPIHNLPNKGLQMLKVNVPSGTSTYMCVETEELEANKTYLVAANVFVADSVPNGSISLSVENAYSSNYQYSDFDYDVCSTGYWQYRLMAFKFDEADNALISLNFENQEGTFYIDNIALYEASPAAVGDFDNIAVTPFELQKNEDGSVSKEYISDGVTSLFNEYTYENNKISSVTDMQGVTTYYSYDPDTGFLNAIGNMKDANGNIVNPTELVTGINNLPTYIEQNVTNISTNADVEMTATCTYDVDERITSITSNGVTYNYEYTGDKLTGVSKNNTDVVDYEYTDGKIGSIVYNNGLTINYVYGTNGLISEVSFLKNNVLVKKYVYTYNADDEIDNVLETVSNMETVYTANGFKLYSISQSNTIPLYEYVKNADESVSETYYPDVVSSKLDSYKDKVSVTKTTTKEEKYIDGLTGETTISSTQTIDKVLNWESDTDFDETIYTLNKYSVNDYFGRVSEKSTTVRKSDNEVGIRITEDYSYKDLSQNTTSTLVSSYTSKVDAFDESGSVIDGLVDKRYYDYDAAGNIVFEYRKEDGVITPLAYYEYDEANQLVGEYNSSKNVSVTYTYDNGGNITSKIVHKTTDVIINNTTNKVENYGTVTDIINYIYDVNSKDLLVNFDNTSISYDNLGNPLNYTGDTYKLSSVGYYANNSVTGTCEWNGEYLTAFETAEKRYTYDYDEDGNRVKKSTYSLNDADEFELNQELLYIWNGEQLSSIVIKSYKYNADDSVTISSTQEEILYDQMGEAVGFVFDNELEWYFVKDLNGSIVAIANSSGKEVVSIYYDAWGQPTFRSPLDTNTTSGLISFIFVSGMITLNPVCYKGYLYDYETGLYFAKEKVYSPSWGRYLNCSYNDIKSDIDYSVSSTNAFAFCANNPINEFDPYSYISTIRAEYFSESAVASGLDIEMNKAFLSKVFCGVFANNLVKKFGSWEYETGYTAYGMDAEFIARSLFAHNIAKYKLSEMNAVNASWGDGWSAQNSLNDSVKVHASDIHQDKYKMIWDAGNLILQQVTVS